MFLVTVTGTAGRVRVGLSSGCSSSGRRLHYVDDGEAQVLKAAGNIFRWRVGVKQGLLPSQFFSKPKGCVN
jgi:hypothetical protein